MSHSRSDLTSQDVPVGLTLPFREKVSAQNEECYCYTTHVGLSNDKEIQCLTCGSKEWPNAFIYCAACLGHVVHGYCLPNIPENLDEYVVWHCDDCEMNRQDKSKSKEIVVMQDQVGVGSTQHLLVEYVEPQSKSSAPSKLSKKHDDLMEIMRKRCPSVSSEGQEQVNEHQVCGGSTQHMLVEHADLPHKYFRTKLSKKYDDLMNIMRKTCLSVSSEGCPGLLANNSEGRPKKERKKKRRKRDEAWVHAKSLDKSGVKTMCKFCRFVSSYGGIARMKGHLSGENPLVPGCPMVSEEVKQTMVQWYNERVKKNANSLSGDAKPR